MNDDYLVISIHLGTALLAGALIGLERTFHGRPAGFRTTRWSPSHRPC